MKKFAEEETKKTSREKFAAVRKKKLVTAPEAGKHTSNSTVSVGSTNPSAVLKELHSGLLYGALPLLNPG